MAVVAHGLLNTMALVVGNLSMLGSRWDALPDATRLELVDRAERHARFVADVLGDLVRGLPADVARVLAAPVLADARPAPAA